MPIQCAFADLERVTNLLHWPTPVVVELFGERHFLGIEPLSLRSAAEPPTGSRGLQPSVGAFSDNFPLELGQGPEDMEDELAAGGRGVDVFLQALETNSSFTQVRDGGYELLERSAQPIQPPDDKGITRSQVVHAVLQAGPLRLGAAHRTAEALLPPCRRKRIVLWAVAL